MNYLPAVTGGPPLLDVIHCCDALTLLKALPDGSVDVMVADLPYGINKANWDAFTPLSWVNEAWRVTKRLLIMTGNPEFILHAQQIGKVKGCVVLHARNGMTRSSIGFGNWIPVLICGEWDWKPRPNHMSYNISITEKIDHPSPKPLAAMKLLINHYTQPGDLILDPFCGSGTTCVAAQKLGRHFIGCDISSEYVKIARERLAMPYMKPLFDSAAGE